MKGQRRNRTEESSSGCSIQPRGPLGNLSSLAQSRCYPGTPSHPPKPSVLSHWAKSVPICPLTSYFFFFLFLFSPFKPLLFFFSASILLSDVGRDERKGQLHLLAICTLPSSSLSPPLILSASSLSNVLLLQRGLFLFFGGCGLEFE